MTPPPVRPPPTRVVHPDGRTFEELNAATGTFKVTDMEGRLVGYTHSERIDYLPSLDEQFRASADTVPRLRMVV